MSTVAGSARVDRQAGVIRSVKIVGNNSKRGRFYPPRVLREAIP